MVTPGDSPARLEVTGVTAGPFAENGYVVRDPEAGVAVVVDPGACGPDLVRLVRDAGDRLDAVVLTHAHLDHVEGIPAVREAFPDVPILLHDDDRPLYDAVGGQAAMFGLPAPRLPAVDGSLTPGEVVPVGRGELAIRFTPGHAPGHVILVSEPDGFAVTGDVVFLGSIGRTDLPGGDFHRLMQSIRDEVLTLPDELRLLAGHGPETTVGHERRHNAFLVPQYRGRFA